MSTSAPPTRVVRPSDEARTGAAQTTEKHAALLAGTSSRRDHHTPPAFALIAPRTRTTHAHHGPETPPVRTAAARQPDKKPTSKHTRPVSIGTIVDPASAVPEPARQNLNTEKNPASTTGFAITAPSRSKRKRSAAARKAAEKAPIFRQKPAKPKLPVNANTCLSYALYYEARHEGSEAQIGLAKVILSRVKSRRYPNTVCGVVYQNAHLRGRCAFSFACDGLLEQPETSLAWTTARKLASQALCGLACIAQKRKTPLVQNAKKRANHTLMTGSVSTRQITDRQMKHMGRDGVNAVPHKITPVF